MGAATPEGRGTNIRSLHREGGGILSISLRSASCTGIAALVALLSLFGEGTAQPGVEVPSCYTLVKLGLQQPSPTRAFVVLVDQTTEIDERLASLAVRNLGSQVVPGNAITIATFSAFESDHYTRRVFAARLDTALRRSQRDNVGKNTLRALDRCMSEQLTYVRDIATKVLRTSLGKPSADVAQHSDIAASLKEAGASLVLPSVASEKVVFVISDMLENSGVTSFYHRRGVRRIDPAVELDKIDRAQLFADFGKAKIYVLGTAVLPTNAQKQELNSYRDPLTIGPLREFWIEYFRRSNGIVADFGQPELLRDIE